MTDSSPSTPQVKRKLLDGESEDFEPEQKTARTSDDEELTAEEAAAAEVQDLLARRKATIGAKEEIEREYEELSMAPEGQHSDFLKEIQGRAEIVNKGAVQNEGFRGKLLDNLAGRSDADNAKEDDEAAALAIIRGTHTGIEDASVVAPSHEDIVSAAKEKMHEATGIPKGMKFDINISPEDVDAADDDDMDGLDVSVDINLDVVVANPRLNTDIQKSRSALAYKGAMKNRRLPVCTVSGSKLVTEEIRKQRMAEVIAREETRAQAVQDVVEDSNREEPIVTSKPVMSTADKVRQALAEKLARPAREETKPTAQQQQVPEWVLARQQKEILKQSSKPGAKDAALSQSGKNIEAVSDLPTSRTVIEQQVEEERQFKPSLSKLAALERPRRRSSKEMPAHQVVLRKTPGSSREGSTEKDVKPSRVQLKKVERKADTDQVHSRSITPDTEHEPVSQAKSSSQDQEKGSEEQTGSSEVGDSQERGYSGVQLRKASLENKPLARHSASPPGFTAVQLKSTDQKRHSPSPITNSKPESPSFVKQEEIESSQASDNSPAFTKVRLRSTGTRLSSLERELTTGDSKHEINESTASKPETKVEPAQSHKVENSNKKEEKRLPNTPTSEKAGEKPTSERATLFAKKRAPPAVSRKPVVSYVTDDVPAWKKALMERRKMGKAAPIPHAPKQDVPLEADKIPQWKRDLMMRRKKTDDKIKIETTASAPNVNPVSSQEPAWFRDLQHKRKSRIESSSSVTSRMGRLSVADDNVPSFIKEFEGRRKKSATPARGLEPEWKKQLQRKASEQDINGGEMV